VRAPGGPSARGSRSRGLVRPRAGRRDAGEPRNSSTPSRATRGRQRAAGRRGRAAGVVGVHPRSPGPVPGDSAGGSAGRLQVTSTTPSSRRPSCLTQGAQQKLRRRGQPGQHGLTSCGHFQERRRAAVASAGGSVGRPRADDAGQKRFSPPGASPDRQLPLQAGRAPGVETGPRARRGAGKRLRPFIDRVATSHTCEVLRALPPVSGERRGMLSMIGHDFHSRRGCHCGRLLASHRGDKGGHCCPRDAGVAVRPASWPCGVLWPRPRGRGHLASDATRCARHAAVRCGWTRTPRRGRPLRSYRRWSGGAASKTWFFIPLSYWPRG